MKKLISLALVLCTITTIILPVSALSGTKGYITKSGTYVAPHYSTSKNKIKLDNWTTKGNINPFTGKKGYK